MTKLFFTSGTTTSLIIRFMRITTITSAFLMAFSTLLTGHVAIGQAITLQFESAHIETVFAEIEKQAKVTFVYQPEDVTSAGHISIDAKGVSIEGILRELEKKTGLRFKLIGNMIGVSKSKPPAKRRLFLNSQSVSKSINPDQNQNQYLHIVSGTVIDQHGEPLIGVNIQVKDENLGTATDLEGKFHLENVAENAVLIISYIGYQTQEVAVDGQLNLVIVLLSDSQLLDEVVVIGYGSSKKSSLTSSISKIENKTLDQVPELRLENALSGRMAGVHILNDRNRPGEAPKIRIRGIGSISAGNEPLVVIDGFPGGDLSQLSMNDVESIEVLKDASAAAIYGSRGGSGVVLVTTKRGGSGTPYFKLNTYFGYSKAMVHDDWMTGEEWLNYIVKYQNREFAWVGGDPSIPAWGDDRRPATYQVDPTVKDLPQTIWQDEVLQTAPMQNYNLSISGGNNVVKYYISGTLADEKGVVKTSSYKKYLLRANVDVLVNDYINLGFELSPSYSKRRIAGQDMVNLVKYPAFVSPHKVNGFYVNSPTGYAGIGNPYVYLYGTENFENRFRNIGRAFINLNILEGLSFKASVGTNISFSTSDYFRGNLGGTDRITTLGSASDAQSFNLINENILHYTKTINGVHEIGGLLGASYQNATSRSTSIGVITNSFNNEIVKTLNNAQVNPGSTTQSKSEWGLVSYFARVNYGFNSKYLFSASYRIDGSSRFGNENKWGNFPSLSIAWRVSEEGFMENIPVISDLKLRASFGVTGNFNIGNFQYLGTVGNVFYSPGNETVKGFAQTTLENSELAWEKTTANDFGVEFGLFKNRLHFTFDYYDSRTSNMLYNVNTPAITGFNNTITNIGEIRNTGVEVEVSSENIVGSFNWNTTFNFSHNKNEVVDLGEVNERINSYWSMDFLLREGEPMFSYYGYKMIGIFQNEEQIENTPTLPDTKPGNPIMKDQNGDGKITPDDKVVLGSFQPAFLLGMGNGFTWKQFDLNIFMQASLGAEILNFENQYYQGNTQGAMRRSLAENQWWSEEDPGDGKTPAAALSQLFGHNTFSDYYVEDASYFSLRSINFGYNFKNIVNNIGVNNLRIYTSINNLLLIKSKDNHSYNPEGTTRGEISGINSTPGVNLGSEPVNRTFVVGLNISF